MKNEIVGRLAPSPTGALHIGNIRTFMVAWLSVRAQKGQIKLRIEDLEHPKHKLNTTAELIQDLLWLGFDWDGKTVLQSERTAFYNEKLKQISSHLYPCECSRSDIQNAQNAPHEGEILKYPGTCYGKQNVQNKALRYHLTENETGFFQDEFANGKTGKAVDITGDFVVVRNSSPAYAFAVVVDDAEMGITDVVRGDDLLDATPSQIVLANALNLPIPRFHHIPLVIGADGKRLAKRHGDSRIQTYRQAGISPENVIATLANSLGLAAGTERNLSLASLISRFDWNLIPKTKFVWKGKFL